MKKSSIAPICEIAIVDESKVELAREKLSNLTEIYNIAEIFKLLGETTRLKILLALFDNELCVCDLASSIDLSISAVSHQLRLLKNGKLVKFRRDGKMVYYSLADDHIKVLIEQVEEHLKE